MNIRLRQQSKRIELSPTNPTRQFKKKQVDKKVTKVIQMSNNTPAQNNHCTGQSLTPLLLGKIQISKLLKVHNLVLMRNELQARGLQSQFDETTNWTGLIKLLKVHKKDNKYFKPVIA